MSDAEKEGTSWATTLEFPNNNAEVQEQTTTDCWIGASPSGPCLQTNGDFLGTTAGCDALITSNVEKEGLSWAKTPKASNNNEVQEQATVDYIDEFQMQAAS